jgi:peptidoglycan hydrolase-like protein with peptidoglycan-binding domain
LALLGPPFVRMVRLGSIGTDVLAIKRALIKSGYGAGIALSPKFGAAVVKDLRRFQQNHRLHVDGVYGEKTHEKLAPYFDRYGIWLLQRAENPLPWQRLLKAMQLISDNTPGYVYGGGHGALLKDVSVKQGLDCSSSCSLALWKAGLFPDNTAWVSGNFALHYGLPGKGRFFTVYANNEHVWIRLERSRWWRFDTSPHGDGGRGPKLRYLPRSSSDFTARHWPGF